MAKDKMKSNKDDSARSLNMRDSAEASYLRQQWDTKQPLQQNKKSEKE
jgi:hypothetical protein